MASTIPTSVNDSLNKIIDRFLETRSIRIRTDHPVDGPKDLLGLTLRFAIEITKREARSMSSYGSLDDCANLISDIFVERSFKDLRTIDSIWSQFQVHIHQDWWRSSLEFNELWNDLLREESASLIHNVRYRRAA